MEQTEESHGRYEQCYQGENSSHSCKSCPGKDNQFRCGGTESFLKDGEVGVCFDGAEETPQDGEDEDGGGVVALPLIKDCLQSSCCWCVCSVEEEKKDLNSNLNYHLKT